MKTTIIILVVVTFSTYHVSINANWMSCKKTFQDYACLKCFCIWSMYEVNVLMFIVLRDQFQRRMYMKRISSFLREILQKRITILFRKTRFVFSLTFTSSKLNNSKHGQCNNGYGKILNTCFVSFPPFTFFLQKLQLLTTPFSWFFLFCCVWFSNV